MIANGLVFAIVVYAALLFEYCPDLYYLAVQEDEYLEWATFWAFLIAATLSIVAAVRQHRSGQELPWLLTGVALFCLFVALEGRLAPRQREAEYHRASRLIHHGPFAARKNSSAFVA